MNPFESMQNDVVYVVDVDGVRSGPFKSSLGSKQGQHSAAIFDSSVVVSEGGRLMQVLPGGREQAFTVLEANYRPAFHGIPEHWILELRKDGSLATPKSPRSQTINISNSTGVQVGDHNVQHIANSLVGLIESIDASNAPANDKAAAKGAIERLVTNPLVAAVLGGATKGIIDLLGR